MTAMCIAALNPSDRKALCGLGESEVELDGEQRKVLGEHTIHFLDNAFASQKSEVDLHSARQLFVYFCHSRSQKLDSYNPNNHLTIIVSLRSRDLSHKIAARSASPFRPRLDTSGFFTASLTVASSLSKKNCSRSR
jgi:hypothetical protein